MFQLIHQDSVFESREQKLEKEIIYYARLPGQFKNEEAIYEEDIPMDTVELGTGQYDSDN